MTKFFRFPSTPHLAWLGRGPMPREDKLLAVKEARDFLTGEVVVEEKLDGANIGFSLAEDGRIQVQNRGQYLVAPYGGQFARLDSWLSQYSSLLKGFLSRKVILFGEWCAARHSIGYDQLPDWFLLFDVYDCIEARFWSTKRRDALAAQLSLSTVPTLLRGKLNLVALEKVLESESSRYRAGSMEGLIIRRESGDWCESRAKLVGADFVQAIDEHWSRRRIEWNRVNWLRNQGANNSYSPSNLDVSRGGH